MKNIKTDNREIKIKDILELIGLSILTLMIIFIVIWSIIALFKCPTMGMDINGCYTEVRNYQSQ